MEVLVLLRIYVINVELKENKKSMSYSCGNNNSNKIPITSNEFNKYFSEIPNEIKLHLQKTIVSPSELLSNSKRFNTVFN